MEESIKANFLDPLHFETRTKASLNWIKRSIEATNFHGSAAFYSRWRKPLTGWEKGYPETTGYIIETLLDYHILFPEEQLDSYAVKCADWLIDIQHEAGYYPTLFGDTDEPSVFNSAQILFGLIRAYEFTAQIKYLNSAQKVLDWLIKNLEPDGSWTIGSYVKGYVPSYYTRAIWAVLYTNQTLKINDVDEKMHRALDYYYQKKTVNNTIIDWAFSKNTAAFTHTIAYTLRGFLESGLLLGEEKYLNLVLSIVKKLEKETKIAGAYHGNWIGNYSFQCITGQAQLAIIFAKTSELINNSNLFNKSLSIFKPVLNAQKKSIFNSLNGAIPGSQPFYKPYMRFKYPNWAVKFFLDAYLQLYQTNSTINQKLDGSNAQ